MARPKSEKPTARELEILQVVWGFGSCSVRVVLNALNQGRHKKIAYNSVQTIMLIMQDKGLLVRSENERTHVYGAAVSREDVEQKLVQSLIDEVFGGSAMRLVSRALSTRGTSAVDADKIEQLLEVLHDTQFDA